VSALRETGGRAPSVRRGDGPAGGRFVPAPGAVSPPDGPVERRRASRSLWSACEALLSAPDPRAVRRALESLRQAFDCDGVALHALGAAGNWSRCARTAPGVRRRVICATA